MPFIVVPVGYSWALASTALTVPLTMWQLGMVDRSRRAARIAYPNFYASDAEAKLNPRANVFNCYQRAVGNTLETMPQFMFMNLITGLKFPYTAAGLGLVWVAGRVLYTLGYATGDPEKRNSSSGAVHTFALFGSLVGSTYTIVTFILEDI